MHVGAPLHAGESSVPSPFQEARAFERLQQNPRGWSIDPDEACAFGGRKDEVGPVQVLRAEQLERVLDAKECHSDLQ